MADNTCNQPPFFGNGTGAEADYVFNFEFINRADVEVYVGEPGNWTQFTEGNSGNANEYQFQNNTTIRLNAPTGTSNVLITRETDRCDPAVEYFAGTSIRAEDLNANQEQTLFLIQELANTLRVNGADQPPGSDGITFDDLEDVDVAGATDRSWVFFNGVGWVNGQALRAADPWVSDSTRIATTEALDARFATQGNDSVGLVWTQDGVNPRIWRANEFREAAGQAPATIATTQILNQGVGGASVLVINIAGNDFVVRAAGQNLNWDEPAGFFTVTVENPAGAPNFINALQNALTAATGTVTLPTANYLPQAPTPAYAVGVTTVQQFRTGTGAGGLSVIQSTTTDLTGGSAGATVGFVQDDGVNAAQTAAWTTNWANATNALAAPNAGVDFLQFLANTPFTVTINGIGNNNNANTAMASNQAGDAFTDNAGNPLGATTPGTFAGRLVYNAPITHSTPAGDLSEITATTTFTRPAGVSSGSIGGGAAGAGGNVVNAITATPNGGFTYPSFFIQLNGFGVPTVGDLVTGQNLNGTVLGNQATTTNRITPAAAGPGGSTMWFCVRDAVGATPNGVRFTGGVANAAPFVNGAAGSVVALQPQGVALPAGYQAENYRVWGIALGANNPAPDDVQFT